MDEEVRIEAACEEAQEVSDDFEKIMHRLDHSLTEFDRHLARIRLLLATEDLWRSSLWVSWVWIVAAALIAGVALLAILL